MLKNEFKILIIPDRSCVAYKRRFCKDTLALKHAEINLAIENKDYVVYKRDETGKCWIPAYRAVFGQLKRPRLTCSQRKKIADEAIDAFINKWLGDTK